MKHAALLACIVTAYRYGTHAVLLNLHKAYLCVPRRQQRQVTKKTKRRKTKKMAVMTMKIMAAASWYDPETTSEWYHCLDYGAALLRPC